VTVHDTRRLLLGEGQFIDDLRREGVLHARFVRSPHAHAAVRALDVRDALAAPQVVAVLTGSDLGPINAPLPLRFGHPGLRDPQMPRPLADGVVRYVGEPVAVVVAHTRYAAADAVERVDVDYDPLPVAASVEAALAPGAPRVHATLDGNLAGTYRWCLGDPRAALASAPVRLSVRLAISRGAAMPIETRGILVAPDADGIRVWASTQSPHYVRRTLAAVLGMAEAALRAAAPDVGGAFGVKGGLPREYAAVAAAAVRLGRPVTWVEDRREHIIACHHDRDQIHQLDIAASREGELLALRDRFLLDVGAYAIYEHLLASHTVNHMIGPYRVPHLEVDLQSVYTHRVPTGAYRGAGRPQGTFVIERVMDHLARALGLDPAVVRERNLIPPQAMPHRTGLRTFDGHELTYDSGDYPAVLRTALDRFGYAGWRAEQRRRTHGRRPLGVGIALYVEETASAGHEAVTLRLDAGGRARLFAGPPAAGQGLAPLLTRIVARELSIAPTAVGIATGDTASTGESFGTFGSRVATIIGNATVLAAREMAGRLREAAAAVLDCDPARVTLRDGAAAATRDGAGVALGELVRRATPQTRQADDPAIEVRATFEPSGAAWSSGAHLAAVELDTHTGAVRIVRYLIVHDSGAVLDEGAVQRQVLGAAVQAIGGVLSERIVYDDTGQPLMATLADYALPRAADVPPIDIVRLETPSPHNPLGMKGAGESGIMPVYAALAAAVEDAIGDPAVSVDTLPLSLQDVWRLVRKRADVEGP
jgi:carbon-monoxide dehydrogenase large subunit